MMYRAKLIRRKLAAIILAVAACIAVCMHAYAGQWNWDGEAYTYAEEDGQAYGWKLVDGQWYYFGSDAKMQTGWLEYGDHWYYLQDSGAAAIGWKQISGAWYYFNDNGEMLTGLLRAGNTKYYLRQSGELALGWAWFDEAWHYASPDGTLCTGWIQDDGRWYLLGSDGSLCYGWHQDDSNWYYLCSDGHMAADCWVRDGSGKPCYLGPDGAWQDGALSWIGDSISARPAGQSSISSMFHSPVIDAMGGRAIYEDWQSVYSGLEAARRMVAEGRMQPTLVFELATNCDWHTPESELDFSQKIAMLRDIVGYNTKIVLVTAYRVDDESTSWYYANSNRQARELSASSSYIAVADWAAVCNPASDLVDGVHPTEAGSVKYMALIQNALVTGFGPQ